MNEDTNKFPVEKPREQDIERLSKEVREIQNKPEFQTAHPKEVIKESLKAFGTPQAGQSQPVQTDTDDLLPSYVKQEPAEIRVEIEKLVQLALREGFEAAIAEARKREGFYVDSLHDALTEKVYPELQKRGVIS